METFQTKKTFPRLEPYKQQQQNVFGHPLFKSFYYFYFYFVDDSIRMVLVLVQEEVLLVVREVFLGLLVLRANLWLFLSRSWTTCPSPSAKTAIDR